MPAPALAWWAGPPPRGRQAGWRPSAAGAPQRLQPNRRLGSGGTPLKTKAGRGRGNGRPAAQGPPRRGQQPPGQGPGRGVGGVQHAQHPSQQLPPLAHHGQQVGAAAREWPMGTGNSTCTKLHRDETILSTFRRHRINQNALRTLMSTADHAEYRCLDCHSIVLLPVQQRAGRANAVSLAQTIADGKQPRIIHLWFGTHAERR